MEYSICGGKPIERLGLLEDSACSEARGASGASCLRQELSNISETWTFRPCWITESGHSGALWQLQLHHLAHVWFSDLYW